MSKKASLIFLKDQPLSTFIIPKHRPPRPFSIFQDGSTPPSRVEKPRTSKPTKVSETSNRCSEIIPRLSLPASLISASSSARNEPINLGSGRAASGCKQPERHGWIIKSVPSTWSRLSKGFVVPRERSGNWSFRNGRNRKWEGFVVKRTWCTVTR